MSYFDPQTAAKRYAKGRPYFHSSVFTLAYFTCADAT